MSKELSDLIDVLYPDLQPRDSVKGWWQFLVMHRKMIQWMNRLLAFENDPNYPRVVGWKSIPWKQDDQSWPVPAKFKFPEQNELNAAKGDNEVTDEMKRKEHQLNSEVILRSLSPKEFGFTYVEVGMHDLMHLRWADSTGYIRNKNGVSDTTNNDLTSYNSAQVNETFWKIHGWIDDRFSAWLDLHPAYKDTLKMETEPWCGIDPILHQVGAKHLQEKRIALTALMKNPEFLSASIGLAGWIVAKDSISQGNR